jgi:hypothetical protein
LYQKVYNLLEFVEHEGFCGGFFWVQKWGGVGWGRGGAEKQEMGCVKNELPCQIICLRPRCVRVFAKKKK